MSLTASATAALITPALTTTFIPTATTCTANQLTMLANRAFEIWMNVPDPVPGTTFTECYPSQYASSYFLQAGSVTQPAFDPLICPIDYSAVGPYTSNYIACCPSGYSFSPASVAPPSDRPAFGGTCYTPLTSGVPYRVTAYGSSGVTATTSFVATVTNAAAYAYPMDGFAFGVAQIASIIPPTTATATSANSAVPTTYTVLADTNPVFTPSSVNANVGDTIIFQFESGNHSVTESSFVSPCVEIENAFDSGYVANIDSTMVPTSRFSLNVTDSSPYWFFSKHTGDCGQGMTFALNPTTDQTYAEFRQAAITQSGASSQTSKSGLSTGAKAGVGIGIGAVALMLISLLLLFLRRCRNLDRAVQEMESRENIVMGQMDNSPSVYTSRDWKVLDEEKPAVPPKGGELHGLSSLVELPEAPPQELYGSDTKHYFAS